jgi:hypothetical protein
MASTPLSADRPVPEALRRAEAALQSLGFSKIAPVVADLAPSPEFWVRESGVPRRAFPVFVEPSSDADRAVRFVRRAAGARGREGTVPRAIVVVPTDAAATEAWSKAWDSPDGPVESEVAILVLPDTSEGSLPHWHAGIVSPRVLLRLATGIAVGLFRRALASEGATEMDFTDMIGILKNRFRVDVAGSLGVTSDEEALFLLYQLAIRDSYAPGDSSANLHLLVLKPTGPAAHLPWFAG